MLASESLGEHPAGSQSREIWVRAHSMNISALSVRSGILNVCDMAGPTAIGPAHKVYDLTCMLAAPRVV